NRQLARPAWAPLRRKCGPAARPIHSGRSTVSSVPSRRLIIERTAGVRWLLSALNGKPGAGRYDRMATVEPRDAHADAVVLAAGASGRARIGPEPGLRPRSPPAVSDVLLPRHSLE